LPNNNNNNHGNFGHNRKGLHTPTTKLICVSRAYLARCVHQTVFLSVYSFCVIRYEQYPSRFAQGTRVPAVSLLNDLWSLQCSCCKKMTDVKKITLAAPCHLAWMWRVTHGGKTWSATDFTSGWKVLSVAFLDQWLNI